MLVSCSSCSAKFNIPDAKVAGKRARMKCKKCGSPIAIDGTGIAVPGAGAPAGKAPSKAPASSPEPSEPLAKKRSRSSPRRPVTASGISTRWRASEPSGTNHEMALSDIASRYSEGGFEPGTLVCAPGSEEWLPPYDHPEVMEKAAPPGEAPPAREPQPTFSEDTVTLGAEESAKLTREAQASEPDGKGSFFGGGDVDDAMDAFDNIMSVAPPKKPSGGAVQLKNVPGDKPASSPPKSSRPSRPAPGASAPPATRPPSSRPPARISSRPAAPGASSPPPPSTRPSRPPAPKPPSPSVRPSAPPPSNPFAPRASSPPSVPPAPSPSVAPPAAPSAPPPLPPSASQPPMAPSSVPPEQGALATSETAPPPAASQPPAPASPSEPTFGNLSQPPKIRKKKSSGLLPIFLGLVLVLGALGGIYLFKPALFERGVNRIKGVLGQETSGPAGPKAVGPPFDAPAAGQVLGQVAGLTNKCKEPGGPTGKGRAQVLYDPAGTASSVAVSKPFHETSVGECVKNMFKDTKVPSFGGDPVVVSKTFEVN